MKTGEKWSLVHTRIPGQVYAGRRLAFVTPHGYASSMHILTTGAWFTVAGFHTSLVSWPWLKCHGWRVSPAGGFLYLFHSELPLQAIVFLSIVSLYPPNTCNETVGHIWPLCLEFDIFALAITWNHVGAFSPESPIFLDYTKICSGVSIHKGFLLKYWSGLSSPFFCSVW